ncbi:MAG: hypothetical protein AB7V45_12495 [Candidatus Krumholzibacteriia bacterium]
MKIKTDDAVALMKRLVDEGVLLANGTGYELSKPSQREVANAQQKYNQSRNQYLDGIRAYIERKLDGDIDDHELESIIECVDDLTLRVMISEREALEVLYGQKGNFNYVANEARRRAADLDLCLESKLANVLALRRLELRVEAIQGISHAVEFGKNYLHTLNRSIVSSFFLIRDPHHVENIRKQATGRTYYLDTNVYLAWVYRSQPSHTIVRTLMNALSRHGAHLCILPETVEEIRRIEAEVERAVPRANGDPTYAKFLVNNRKAIFTDFWWARQEDQNLKFSVFAELYMNPDSILKRLRIIVEPIEFEEGENFESEVPTFRNAIRGVKEDRHRVVREEALEHDAQALLRVGKLQLRGERDAWGSLVQFLSLDSSLGVAVDEVRNVLNRRLERPTHPLALANIYLPTAGHEVDQNEYEDFVVAAVRRNLGLMDEVSGYSSVALVDKLDQAGIPTKTLLAAPRELLEPALAQLQGRKNLNRRLDLLLATPIEKREELVIGIQKDLEEAISVGSDLLREKEEQYVEEAAARRDVQGRLEEMNRELTEVRICLEGKRKRLIDEESAVEELRDRLRRMSIRVGVAFTFAVVVIGVLIFLLLSR